jgi:hypothetical protein
LFGGNKSKYGSLSFFFRVGVFFFFFFFFFRYSLSSINTVNQNCASKESDIMTFGNFVIAFRCLTVWKIKRRPEFCCDFC